MGMRDAVLRSWCSRQLHPWEARGLRYGSVADELHALNESERSLFLFVFKAGTVALAAKPEQLSTVPWEIERAQLYRRFFEHVVKARGEVGEGVLAMSLSDVPTASETSPIFGFQKSAGSSTILINDIDFIWHGFFKSRAYADPFSYESKRPKAVFAGSTSGSNHDVASVRALTDPRVRAFAAFKASDLVDFRLPRIVQCLDETTVDLMVEMGLGRGEQTWRDQFEYRFILSMDGNGATCSRVALALKSRSVLVKYDSPYELYYFGSLVPWLHYIPVTCDADVLAVVRMERDDPGRFRAIGQAGRRFYLDYLTEGMGLRYAGLLLSTYFSRVCRKL